MQPGSVNSVSIDKTDDVQPHIHPEISKYISSSDSPQCTYYTKPVSVELGFRTQEIPVVRMASVIFAGEDTPENVLSDTCQELFCSGSFMVSDDDILENLTLIQLELSKF